MTKLICGVGVHEKGKYVASCKEGAYKEYRLWSAMLHRCYSSHVDGYNPTYSDCTVSDNFKNFQFFAEWCNQQFGFGKEDWQLDKDLLSTNNNKIYSEDVCVFVPRELNVLLCKNSKTRGGYPIGVNYHRASLSFVAQLNINGSRKHLGCYATPEEAFRVYKDYKEHHIKEKAHEWKDLIDPRVYTTLLNYEVIPFP